MYADESMIKIKHEVLYKVADWNLYNISITGVSPVVGRMVK